MTQSMAVISCWDSKGANEQSALPSTVEPQASMLRNHAMDEEEVGAEDLQAVVIDVDLDETPSRNAGQGRDDE